MDKKWYQKASNWIFIIACLILIPILVLNMSIIFQAQTDKDKVPSVFGYKPFMVLSGSMESEIRKGDLIITKVIEPEELMLHDVIAFRDAQGTVTTHRIIDIVDKNGVTYFITKGDNNSTQDLNLVDFASIEGIYVGRIPGIGSIMESLSQPTTFMIIFGSITLIFIICFTISSNKQKKLLQEEFLEYKKMKELEEKKKIKREETKKLKSIKAENEESPKKSSAKKVVEEKKTTSRKKATTSESKATPEKKTTRTKKVVTDEVKAPVKRKTTTTKKSTTKDTTTKKATTGTKKSTTKKSTVEK